MIDRRRSELRTDSATLGLVLMVMGWYASPWQPMDTTFTRVLDKQGLEDWWGILLLLIGTLKVFVSVVTHRPTWLEKHWRHAQKTTSLLIVFISFWTFFHFVEAGLFTPTVLAMGVIGAGTLATMIRDAITKKSLRCRYGSGYNSFG